MVHMDKLNKENCIKGVPKARPAPDFSKLHRQWDLKLQKVGILYTLQEISITNHKGKAVVKKPLTDVQPFSLTQSRKSSSTSSSDGEFQIDEKAKESILNCDVITESNHLHKRATIGVTSQRHYPSRIPQRNSLYVNKSVFGGVSSSENETRSHQSPQAISRQKSFMKSPAVKKRNVLQGFSVDFQPDADALESILNCEGIPASRTPSKLSSQFGPTKSKRVKGRVVPFQKPVPNSRSSFNARSSSQADILASKKQRWSIYSRDSFTTKPDLMTWLKGLMEQPVPNKKLNKSSHKTAEQVTSVLPASTEKPRLQNEHQTDMFVKKTGLKFDKTLVGYQGDRRGDEVVIGEATNNDFPLASYSTPSKQKNAKSEVTDGSAVRSILKKKTCDTSNVKRTPFKTILEEKTPSQDKRKPVVSMDCTPLRLSAYARNQRLLGLPLPKENRYERMGERIDEPVSASECDHLVTAASNGQPSNATIDGVKHVRWAENLRNSLEPKESVNESGDQFSFEGTKTTTAQVAIVTNKDDEKPAHINKNSASVKTFSNAANSSWADVLSQDDGALTAKANQHTDHSRLKAKFNDASAIVSPVRTPSSHQKLPSRSADDVLGKKPLDKFICSMEVNVSDVPKQDDIHARVDDASYRPLPALDGKLIEKLMTFAEDDGADDYLSVFANRELMKDNLQSTLMQTPQRKEGEPLPGVDLNVNSKTEEISEAVVAGDNSTPPCLEDLSTTNNETVSKVLEAPCKRVKAVARTPYKQVMLDYLENALALSRKRQSESLNCTIGLESDVTPEEFDQTHQIKTKGAQNRLGVQMSQWSDEMVTNSCRVSGAVPIGISQSNLTSTTSAHAKGFVSREDTALVNILSPSMRKFPTTQTSESLDKSVFATSRTVEITGDQNKKTSEIVTCKQILKPASFNPDVANLRPSESKPIEADINRHAIYTSLTTPTINIIPITSDQSSKNRPFVALRNGFTENPQKLLQPLFSTLTSGHAFKTSGKHQEVKNVNLMLKPSTFTRDPRSSNQIAVPTTNENTDYIVANSNLYSKLHFTEVMTSSANVLKPSILASHLTRASPSAAVIGGGNLNDRILANQMIGNAWCATNFPRTVEDTIAESSMVDQDTDICLVFKNPPGKSFSRDTKDTLVPDSTDHTCSGLGLNRSDNSFCRLDSHGSAFRHVPPVCNAIPRHQTVCASSASDPSSDMKLLCKLLELLVAKPYTRDSVLNAEVSLYTKFGEISEKYGQRIHRKRDGAGCALEKVLTDGDEQVRKYFQILVSQENGNLCFA